MPKGKWIDGKDTRAWWGREMGLYDFIKLCAGERKGVIAELKDYGIHGFIYAGSEDFLSHVRHIEFSVSSNLILGGKIEDIASEGLKKYGGNSTSVDVYDGGNVASHDLYRLSVNKPAKKFATAAEEGMKTRLESCKRGLISFWMQAKYDNGNGMFVKKHGRMREKELEAICSLFSRALGGFKARAWNVDYVI